MKKLFSIVLFALIVLGWGSASAQCNIVTPNTTVGISPSNPDDTLTQGVSYSQTFQVYVPSTYSGFTVDSVHIASITGGPTGLTIVYNPADGGGGTVKGGANGAICFNGTTNSAVGTYPLTFTGTVYTNVTNVPLSTLAADFTYSFNVKAAPAVLGSCDTLFNLLGDTTTTLYTVGTTADSGYISGNNFYGDLAKVEGFATTPGAVVNSAILYFAIAKINTTDTATPVTVGVWDNTGTSGAGHAGAPGNLIDSAHVSLGEIAAALTSTYAHQALVGLLVNFHGVASPGDTVYVGVILPSTTGDTLAFFINGVPGAKGNGWEEASSGGQTYWETYNNDWGFGGNIGNLIIADICSSAATGYPTASFTSVPSSTSCASSPVTFTDNSTATPAPSLFNWNFGDGSSSSTKNPSHTYTTAGTYTVTEYVANNLGGAYQDVVAATSTITVTASPSLSSNTHEASSSSSNNGSVVVTATGGTAPYSFAWSGGSNNTTDSLGGLTPGTYTVTVTDANNCTSTSSSTINVTGILNLSNAATVTVYPNPATDVLNLVWSQKSNAEVSIVDLNGRVISTLTATGDMKTTYDVHALAAGSYIVRITDKTNNQQQSLLFSKF